MSPMRNLLFAPFLLTVACAGMNNAKKYSSDENDVAETPPAMVEKASNDGLILVEIDLNSDGRPEVFNYYRERTQADRLLVRKEVDLNKDSRIDVRSFYDETGTLTREEMDGDFDGQVDWVDHYQGERRVMSEVDTDYNGVFDLFKYYEGGNVKRKERDTDGDGRVDFWEHFDAEGNVDKVGRDTDGDGQMDVRE